MLVTCGMGVVSGVRFLLLRQSDALRGIGIFFLLMVFWGVFRGCRGIRCINAGDVCSGYEGWMGSERTKGGDVIMMEEA